MPDTVLLLLLACGAAMGSKWSYDGLSGPRHWHSLFPHGCSGLSQSPIDIDPEQTLYSPDLKDFAIWYDPPKPNSSMTLHNNGHAVQVDLQGEFYVSNGGLQHVYRAAQFHFHWGHAATHGSEHTLAGRPSPIEMHLVTYNQDRFPSLASAATEQGGLAVLGVMFEVSKEDNPAFKDIVRALKHVRDPDSGQKISLPLLSIRSLLPVDISRYFRYNGSLTTPGCFESVTWTIFDHKQTLSHRQLKEFRKLLQPRRHHAGHGRHRRSPRADTAATDVLVELGVLGDAVEEDKLQGELMMSKMYSDMPAGGHHEATVHDKDRSSQGSDVLDDTKTTPHVKMDEAPSQTDHKTTESDIEYKAIEMPVEPPPQQPLVNNYRPVQPLNDRLVHRSFKLAPPAVQVDESISEGSPYKVHSEVPRSSHSHSHSHSHSGGVSAVHKAGLTGLLVAVLSCLC